MILINEWHKYILSKIIGVNIFVYRKEKEDFELEISELKQKLNLKNTEFITLQQEFQEKAALLSLNELRIQQVILYKNYILLKIIILLS